MSKYKIDERVEAQINNAFTYHSPQEDQAERYTKLRSKAKSLAVMIAENTPPSREQSLALTKLEEAVMFANSAIARNEGALSEVTVSVNGKEFKVPATKLTFTQVVEMVGERNNASVSYRDALGGISGILIQGVAVRVCKGTKFTVAVTG